MPGNLQFTRTLPPFLQNIVSTSSSSHNPPRQNPRPSSIPARVRLSCADASEDAPVVVVDPNEGGAGVGAGWGEDMWVDGSGQVRQGDWGGGACGKEAEEEEKPSEKEGVVTTTTTTTTTMAASKRKRKVGRVVGGGGGDGEEEDTDGAAIVRRGPVEPRGSNGANHHHDYEHHDASGHRRTRRRMENGADGIAHARKDERVGYDMEKTKKDKKKPKKQGVKLSFED